jgi:hypothetical protein
MTCVFFTLFLYEGKEGIRCQARKQANRNWNSARRLIAVWLMDLSNSAPVLALVLVVHYCFSVVSSVKWDIMIRCTSKYIWTLKGRGWPMVLGSGIGLGMAYSNCQNEFKKPFVPDGDIIKITDPKLIDDLKEKVAPIFNNAHHFMSISTVVNFHKASKLIK